MTTTVNQSAPLVLLARPARPARPGRPAHRPLRVLHLEDSDADGAVVRRYLERQGFGDHVVQVHNRADFLEHLTDDIDIVLADHTMPGFDSGEALRIVQQRCPRVPLIIVSGTITEEAAVGSIKSGAADYIWKDRLQRLGPAIANALRERRHQTEHEAALRATGQSEALGRAVLSSLSQLICVIDTDGVIVATNLSWKSAGAARSTDGLDGLDVGTNYLDVCRRAAASGDDIALDALAGITAVLAGEQDDFSLEYPCHAPTYRAWYVLCATPLGDERGAILSHQSVTDLRETQESLSQNETRLKAIFEGSLDAILLADDDGRYVEVNPAASALLGYSQDEFLRMGVADILSVPAGRDFGEYWAALRTRGTDSGEYDLNRKDGTVVEVEGRATFNVLPGLHLSTLRDITERKAAEALRRENEEQFVQIAEAMPQIVWTTDAEGYNDYRNERWYAYSGMERPAKRGEQIAQFQWADYLHPDDVESLRARWTRSIATGEPYEMEYRFRRAADGEYRWFIGRAIPVRDDTGAIVRWFGTSTDIHDLRDAEESLRKSEERFRLVSRATNDTVWDWDLSSESVFMNAAFTEVFGWQEPADGGFTIGWMLDRIHPDDRNRLAESLHGIAWGDEQEWQSEYRFGRADGTWADVLNRAYIVRSADGTAVRVVGAVLDRSARKETERALVAAKEAAEEVSRAKSSLLMNMSHEIRTPLTAVIGYAEMLAQEAPPDLLDLVEPIERGGKRLLETLNSVLDLAQIDAGSLLLATIAVDLRAEAEAAVAALEPLAQAKGLLLALSGPPTVALADRAALARVLANLVGNAIKFTERGTVAVEVWAEGGSAWLRVTDSGVGVDAEFLPHVFDDFKQESSGANRSHEGSGLGLTITRGLVTMMDGEISAASEKGVGSTFTVRLPAA